MRRRDRPCRASLPRHLSNGFPQGKFKGCMRTNFVECRVPYPYLNETLAASLELPPHRQRGRNADTVEAGYCRDCDGGCVGQGGCKEWLKRIANRENL
jgi:hypothetical protein